MKADRLVIWMVEGAMEKYEFFKTQAHDLVPPDNGGQVRALQGAVHATSGVSILIPSLLYLKANLPGTILQIEEAAVAGVEEVNKRRCTKITAVAAAYYPSGQRTSIRPVTLWIDAEDATRAQGARGHAQRSAGRRLLAHYDHLRAAGQPHTGRQEISIHRTAVTAAR